MKRVMSLALCLLAAGGAACKKEAAVQAAPEVYVPDEGLPFIRVLRRFCISFLRWVDLVPPYVICEVAMFWVIERRAAF